MLEVRERLLRVAPASVTLTLPFEKRCKSRLRASLDNGQEVALSLPRGTVLRHGDLLRGDDGTVIQVCAALESVATVRSQDTRLLVRACYHLGNRHVPVEIGDGRIRYLDDHVLNAMLKALGLTVSHEQAPFEPESGAYHGHAH